MCVLLVLEAAARACRTYPVLPSAEFLVFAPPSAAAGPRQLCDRRRHVHVAGRVGQVLQIDARAVVVGPGRPARTGAQRVVRQSHGRGRVAAQGNQGLEGGWAIDDSGHVNFVHSVVSELPFMQQAVAGVLRVNFRLGACFTDWTSAGCATADGPNALAVYDQWAPAPTSGSHPLRRSGAGSLQETLL